MPYIDVKTNLAVTPAQEETVKSRLGQAVTCIGKSEGWLMVQIAPEGKLYFRGRSDRPLAFVSVRLFGRAGADAYEKLTGEITGILHSALGIDPDGVYVQYEETAHWGFNGHNF